MILISLTRLPFGLEPREARLASQRHHIFRMAHMLFTCPTTSMKVQHWLDEGEDAPENQYEGITCPACTRLRFLNRRTGELLGHDEE